MATGCVAGNNCRFPVRWRIVDTGIAYKPSKARQKPLDLSGEVCDEHARGLLPMLRDRARNLGGPVVTLVPIDSDDVPCWGGTRCLEPALWRIVDDGSGLYRPVQGRPEVLCEGHAALVRSFLERLTASAPDEVHFEIVPVSTVR